MSEEKKNPRSEDEECDEPGKKHCIPSSSSNTQAIPPSPPRFVSLEELMTAAKGMTNMSLAHEIVVNKDFKLEKREPSSNAEKVVKEIMHKTFWKLLADELTGPPSSYKVCFALFQEVKDNLSNLLLPQHSRLREQINSVLDISLIKQQAANGSLNFQEYAQFVISVMGKMCAPVRDEKIAELTRTTEVEPLFRGILETLELMRIDMANFTIDLMRPHLVANSVAYEKQKFADFLKFKDDGLALTKKWLLKHVTEADKVDSTDTKKKIDAVINHAYLDLAQWDPSEPLPETLTMDEARIKEATQQLLTLTLTGAVLLITFSHAGPNLSSIAEWKRKVKEHLLALFVPGETADLQAVAVKMTADMTTAAEKYNVTGHTLAGLEDDIKCVTNVEHRVVSLLSTRVREFLLSAITSRTAERLQIPPGLSILQDELTKLTGGFLRMVSYNRAVFEEYYINIVQESLSPAS